MMDSSQIVTYQEHIALLEKELHTLRAGQGKAKRVIEGVVHSVADPDDEPEEVYFAVSRPLEESAEVIATQLETIAAHLFHIRKSLTRMANKEESR